jgi:hypothetical protein
MARHLTESERIKLIWLCCWAVTALGLLSPSVALAQKFEIKPVAEKKLSQLPPGPLFWRIENFPTLAQAEAAAGPTGLAAEVAGKVWLFTLGAKGGSSSGGSAVAEIGPVPPITAPEYLLRINSTGGPPGVKTPVHTHAGSETFYVLTGQLSQKSPHGESHVDAGQSMPGHGPGMPMEVSSSGTTDLNALVMFVVDATKPFSTPATMP